MLLTRFGLLVALGVGLVLVAACDDGGGGKQVEKLFSPQANELDVYDLETGEMTVLIPSEKYNVNGQVCALPDGSGNFLMGEDTNQSDGARQGWGIFSPDGEIVQKILDPETAGEAETPEPYGCAFDDEGRLFTTDIGDGSFEAHNGKLLLFFPEDDFGEVCILDTEIRVAGQVAIDDDGGVLVPEGVPPGNVLRYAGPFPSSAAECETVKPTKSVFIQDPEVLTPLGIARAPNGNWYLSSVFIPTAIREYDANGQFVRTIVEGEDIGNPAGLAVGSDGTLYYADLGLDQQPGELPGPAPGKSTVRKVTFDADGNPSAPEVMGSGFDYADGLGIVFVEE
jgi:hypothetical protein